MYFTAVLWIQIIYPDPSLPSILGLDFFPDPDLDPACFQNDILDAQLYLCLPSVQVELDIIFKFNGKIKFIV
jgi:hypothetical protein